MDGEDGDEGKLVIKSGGMVGLSEGCSFFFPCPNSVSLAENTALPIDILRLNGTGLEEEVGSAACVSDDDVGEIGGFAGGTMGVSGGGFNLIGGGSLLSVGA